MPSHVLRRAAGLLALFAVSTLGCGETTVYEGGVDVVADPGMSWDEGGVEDEGPVQDPGEVDPGREDPGPDDPGAGDAGSEDPGAEDRGAGDGDAEEVDPGQLDEGGDVAPDAGPGPVVPPAFMSSPSELALAGHEYRYRARVAIPGEVELELSTAPAGMTLEGGVLSWTAGDADAELHDVGVRAVAGELEATQEYRLRVMTTRKLAGGEVGSAGGAVWVSSTEEGLKGAGVVVPAGAVDEGTRISISALEGAPPLAAVRSAETVKALVLGPSGIYFNKPVQLHLPYGPEQDEAAGDLLVYVFDEASGRWSVAPVAGRDTVNRVVVAEVAHFSVFAAGAPELELSVDVLPADPGCARPITLSATLAQPLSQVPVSAVDGLSPLVQHQVAEAPGVNSARHLIGHPAFAGTLRGIRRTTLVDPATGSLEDEQILASSVVFPGDGSARRTISDAAGNVLFERADAAAGPVIDELAGFLTGAGSLARLHGPLATPLDLRVEIFFRYAEGDASATPIPKASLGRVAASARATIVGVSVAGGDADVRDLDCDGVADSIDVEVDTARPVIEASPRGTIAGVVGEPLSLSCAVPGEGEALSLSWSSDAAGDDLVPDGGEGLTLTPASPGLRRVTCRLEVEVGSAAHTFAVDVAEAPQANTPPTCSITVLDPVVHAGAVAELVATARDGESDAADLVVHWGLLVPGGAALIPSPILGAATGLENSLATTAPKVYEVGCQADDGIARGPIGRAIVEVVEVELDLPPEPAIVTPRNVQVAVGEAVDLVARSSDPEGAELLFTWSPEELFEEVASAAHTSVAVFRSREAGIYPVTVGVTDGERPQIESHAQVVVLAAPAVTDDDGDGFGRGDAEMHDCDDTDPTVNPAADEVCGDGLDNDCDALTDELPDGQGGAVPCAPDELADADGDGVADELDNCPEVANPSQLDADGDGTGDACGEEVCVPACEGRACGDDGCAGLCGVCPEGEVCDPGAGACTAGADPCDANPDCDDGEPCTHDGCVPRQGCAHFEIEGLACDDGNSCTVDDLCSGGSCAGLPVTCPDGDPCTLDGCDPERGCTHDEAPDETPCEDFNRCTVDSVCKAGACVGATPVDCDDGNECTVDSCDTAAGCAHEPPERGTACDDGDECSVGDTCLFGICVGRARDCDDGNVCTDDSCDPELGCAYSSAPAGSPCDDGLACHVDDVCQAMRCVPGEPLSCDDGEVCTSDGCDDEVGCTSTPVEGETPCDDGDACTEVDMCAEGSCVGGAPLECGDDNVCTADTCDPASGCVNANEPDGLPCDDGDICTSDDDCREGVCGGVPRVCDDDNVCTDDACEPGRGCTYKAPAEARHCDDGDFCTRPDLCLDGECRSGSLVDCEDGNVCTDDSCDAVAGCLYDPVADGTPCDDRDECTSGDECAGGGCVSGLTVDCDDDNPCTAEACHPVLGCVYGAEPAGHPCDDGDPCTGEDSCQGEICVPGEPVCDFGDAPSSYGTSASADGARHAVVAPDGAQQQPRSLGSCVDVEADAFVSDDAGGDDRGPGNPLECGDDEDGVSFDGDLAPGSTARASVLTSGPAAFLDAWVDFDRDGTWEEGSERIATALALVGAGEHELSFEVPAGAVLGETFARFRLSSEGAGLPPGGFAADGEVEDHPVVVGPRSPE